MSDEFEPKHPEDAAAPELTPDVAPKVEEFMAETALANEAEGTAAAEDSHFAAGGGLEAASFAAGAETGPYISFENVCKSFGDLVVLEDVSFFINPGETLCILGRSGVGKSVSLQILMGFLKADSGTVMVAGQDIGGLSEREMQEVRRKVTMVFQNGALFDSITVGENVAFPLREHGNMQEDQILLVVKGLLAVLYDEPTTMVDPLMGHLLGDLIQRLKMQLHLTSIVVTHDMRFAEKLADRVVFLHEGKALFFGTMEEMRRSEDPVLREFFELDELTLPV